ncbi:MAG TPA: NAD(P)/FAD-dependent oxidoreductase [Candidatus Dormibacteraeota bacterium]|nr:NAD(P)/FAD-dependent oxidoreductase [Candidatus Dormibacteraeota bacterium]
MAVARHDAVVVGAGPNGLAAAITLARAGRSVQVLEAAPTAGGGCRSAALTLPGFTHDVCSAVHPLAAGSLFLRTVPLREHGLELVQPDIPLAHPLDIGEAAVLHRDLAETCEGLGADGRAYRLLFGPLVADVDRLLEAVHGPLRLPRHPVSMIGFGLRAMWPASTLARVSFRGVRARALFSGMAGHSMLPLNQPFTAAVALLLGTLGHAFGWPFAKGGSQALTDALVGYLRSLGGEVVLNRRVESLADVPPARAVLFDLTPRQVEAIAGKELSPGYRRSLERFRYGPGVFKVDWALKEPIPWAAAPCRRAGTVHLGGTMGEIAAGESAVWAGKHPDRPYVLLAQPSLFDPSRAPAGKHTVWAYCHVPSGSETDMTDRIEAQVDRFAPGFRDVIEARSVMNARDMERYNPNYVGGDINGGVQDIRQLFTRPAVRPVPYTTSNPRLFICSSSTPPGGGVHGMCGYFAARAALARVLK